jgi:hypothetical protein
VVSHALYHETRWARVPTLAVFEEIDGIVRRE